MRDKNMYLFDITDKKQRGKGVDKLGDISDGVQLIWKQTKNYHSSIESKIGLFKLEVLYFYTYYDSEVFYVGNLIKSSRNEYKSKIEAQIGAEQLLVELHDELSSIINNMKILRII